MSVEGKISEIARLFNKRENSIRKWAECYVKYGIEGLRGDVPLRENAAIKQELVLCELSKLLSGEIFK